MKLYFLIVLFLVTETLSELKLVHVFFRHGSRTPELKDTFPSDPNKAEAFYPTGYGQLTNVGKQRAYRLGKLLRKRYDSFLGSIYYPEILTAQSTDFDRTKMSLLLLLAGLFKPAPSQVWDEEVTWLPIPYSYDKEETDFTLRRPNSYCPAYYKELQEVLNSDETRRLLKDKRELMSYLSEKTGRNISTLQDMFAIYQTLHAEKTLNLTWDQWAVDSYDEIRELAVQQCVLENSNDVLKRLNGGRMLSKIIDHMKLKAENALKPSEKKIFLYSGHENNVINILAALDLYYPHFPQYSAAVIIELHYDEASNEHVVKVMYSKDVDREPEEQKLEGCEDWMETLSGTMYLNVELRKSAYLKKTKPLKGFHSDSFDFLL